MNKLQQLEAKIQEAVPEIMELKFGCRVLLENDVKRTILKDNNGKGYYFSVLENDLTLIREGIEEILGRPITLEDVLMAIDISKKKTPLVVGINGEFSEEIQNGWKGHETWKLGSPLQDQPEETIDFLHSLIVKE